jgi:hypothetical protein
MTISFQGIECFSDITIATQPSDPYDGSITSTLFMASLFGPAPNVEAVCSAIIVGRSVDCAYEEMGFETVRPVQMSLIRSVLKKFETGVVHKLVYFPCWFGKKMDIEDESNQAVIIAPDLNTARRRAFNILDARTVIPLKPEWDSWLWENAFHHEQLFTYGSENLDSHLISWPDEDELAEQLLEGVKNNFLI